MSTNDSILDSSLNAVSTKLQNSLRIQEKVLDSDSNGIASSQAVASTQTSKTGDPNGKPMLHNSLFNDEIRQSSTSQSESPSSTFSNNNSRTSTGNVNPLSFTFSKRKQSHEILSKLGTENLKSVKSHAELAETAYGVRMLAKNLAKATIQIDVKSIMIVTKARDNSLIYLTREVSEWLLSHENRDITVYVDYHLEKSKRFDAESIKRTYPKAKKNLKFWNKRLAAKNPEKFDLVLTLGGDGTVLYVSNLFQRIVPPVMSFSLGSLGFLTNFDFKDFRESMSNILLKGVRANLRMRFTCRVHTGDGGLVCEQQVLNELVVDRGPSPFVSMLELYGDGSLLTVAQADGLIIATPTGSTAYSLSAGGSLVHPGVSAISVTPICPHTLSFRPILLPDGMLLKVKVPETSRATAYASFDGRVRLEMKKGDYVTIQASPFPFPTVVASKTEYFDSVSRNLNWNARETQKPFTHLLSKNSQRRYYNSRKDKKKARASFDVSFEDTSPSSSLGNDEHVKDLVDTHAIVDEDEDSDGEDYEEFEIDDDDTGSEHTIDDEAYLPSPGAGLDTPPEAKMNFHNFDDKTCFAHPNATVSLANGKDGSVHYGHPARDKNVDIS